MGLLEIYRQGQRDAEQGWPPLAYLWNLTPSEEAVYFAGYVNPRI